MASEVRVDLIAHPDAAGPLRSVTVAVQRDGARLHLRYRFEGDVTRVRLPAPAEPCFTVGLWEHTCAEAFVAAEGATAYHELNLSPSGEWAAFAFTDYRVLGNLDGDVPPPRIEARAGGDALDLAAVVALDSLAPGYASASLRLGLSAVVESVDGGISYWSLFHPPGKADFHHHSTRTLPLAATPARTDR